MRTDPIFCANSFLTYRAIVTQDRQFSTEVPPVFYHHDVPRRPINTTAELDAHLRRAIDRALQDGPAALMLSSGMDSAILAAYLPAGTRAYTLRCVAPGATDETDIAAGYAEKNGLDHRVIDVEWSDFERCTLPLMRRKGCPIHSIEVQVYKAALQARADGIKTLIFGETADIIYGGHSKLLARDWDLSSFYRRFAFVDPTQVLCQPLEITAPILPYVNEDGNVDVFAFLNGFEYDVSLGFYNNACALGEIKFFSPYSSTVLGHPLDLDRIRSGDGKYIVRGLFRQLYPELPVPPKTPLPRPMAQWLRDWTGPLHPALRPDCLTGLTGDQKWYVYTLNEFLLNFLGDDEYAAY